MVIEDILIYGSFAMLVAMVVLMVWVCIMSIKEHNRLVKSGFKEKINFKKEFKAWLWTIIAVIVIIVSFLGFLFISGSVIYGGIELFKWIF